MKNAHLRFGFVEFEKAQKDTATKIHLAADRFIGERESGKAHLVSVIGGDSDIGAIFAAVQLNESLLIGGPGLPPRHYRLGERAHLHRGTINVPGRKRPARHLVAVSAELQGDGETGSIILQSDSSEFVLGRIAIALGLPLLPNWAIWFSSRLQSQTRIHNLAGLNCSPVSVTGTKAEFLDWIGAALKTGDIVIPQPLTPSPANPCGHRSPHGTA
jgi:hypothetical protein